MYVCQCVLFTYPGYVGVYQKRTGSHMDGSAIFYLTSRLSLVQWSGVEYQKHVRVLNRDNVGVVGQFAVVDAGTGMR